MLKYILLPYLLLVNYSLLFAQKNTKKKYLAEKCTSPVVIDGILDDKAWELRKMPKSTTRE